MRRSESVNATYEGVVRAPWSLAMISTLFHEFARREETRMFRRGKVSSVVFATARSKKAKEKRPRPCPSQKKKCRVRVLWRLMRDSHERQTPRPPSNFRSRRDCSTARVDAGPTFFRDRPWSSARPRRGGGDDDVDFPAPSAEMFRRTSREMISGGRPARGASGVSIEARSRRDLVAAEWRLFSERRDPRESRLRAGYVPVVLPDTDAGVRRAEVDPDGGAVNLGHDVLTVEVNERESRACARRTGK